jgi:hypothetical protein
MDEVEVNNEKSLVAQWMKTLIFTHECSLPYVIWTKEKACTMASFMLLRCLIDKVFNLLNKVSCYPMVIC